MELRSAKVTAPLSPRRWTPSLEHLHWCFSAADSDGICSAAECICTQCFLPQSAPISGLAARPWEQRAAATRAAAQVARAAA
eukprot:3162440-Pyramimonas_sp.AAC.1